MTNMPLGDRKHYLRFIESSNTALAEPEKWCLDGECKDTNWGGRDRLHHRSENCPVARPTELERLSGVASARIREIDAVWSNLAAKEFTFLDDAQRDIYDYVCLSWVNGGAYDIAALTVASVERDTETLTYRVSVSFEEFWNTVPYYRRDVLKQNVEDAQSLAKLNDASDAAVTLTEGIRNLGAGVPVPYDELVTAVQKLTDAALNRKEQS